ncbi:hypothetical protein SAMD00023353_2000330 [Rosellinia necatrix]|uniref:SRR1-like domain-containing protein n=1 Tax=Rosellinia necatrix TaxID=77044 RepID=A0A1W2TF78_ROSNE|nr:hypothetical protein SAMD00023353_2000330 [Rosellinia necatrix]
MEEHPPQQEEAWAKVHRRKGRRPAKDDTIHATPSSVLTPGAPSLTLDQVRQDHDRLAGQWKSSGSYSRLRELLSAHTTGAGSSVTKAICFGLGSFNPPNGEWDWKRRTHIQLAAFLAIVEHLQSKTGQNIRCVFQEPVFNSVDKAFITSLGHEVVESPVGFQLVDPDTLAFAVHLYRNVHSQVIATHIPAIFVGTSYAVWEE